MGLYNIITLPCECRSCGLQTTLRVQFKVGFLWLLEFELGQPLEWVSKYQQEIEGRDREVPAWTEACPACGHSGDRVLLSIQGGCIVGARYDDSEHARLEAIEAESSYPP